MRSAGLAILLSVVAFAQQDATEHLKKARELVKNPERVTKEELNQAREELQAALRLRPDYTDARIELAKVQVLQREHAAALGAAGEMLRADPQNLEAHFIRASALVGMGKPGVARLLLVDLAKEHPDSPDVYFQLGAASLADRRFPEAVEAFRKVWELEPGNMRGLQWVAETYVRSEQPGRAIEFLQSEASKAPDRVDIQFELGRFAARARKPDIAIPALQMVIAKSEKPHPDALALLGETYNLKGDVENAIAALRRARDAAPEDPRVLASLGMILDQAGHKKEAAEVYRATLEIRPKEFAVLNNLAYLLADTGGDLKEALSLAQRARELAPNLAEITDTVGWIYLKGNMVEEAISLFEYIVLRNPTHPSYRYHLGLAKFQKGDKAGALTDLRRALADGPSKEDAEKIRELLKKLEG